jgi:hypothetical protein
VAGLAGLGPPGALIAANLLPENSNTNRSARIYCIGDGHAIWKTDAIGGGTLTGAVDCLQRNHTAVVAQIAGLGGMVNWAADRVARHLPVDVAVQPVLERALRILYRLHDGQKTYRSEVAKARVAPILADMDAIKVATGLGAP